MKAGRKLPCLLVMFMCIGATSLAATPRITGAWADSASLVYCDERVTFEAWNYYIIVPRRSRGKVDIALLFRLHRGGHIITILGGLKILRLRS
jgi:hypothetical protein